MSASRLSASHEDLAEASAWLARLRADDCTAADRDSFATWLAWSESRRAAFEIVTAAFEAAGAVTDRWPREVAVDGDAAIEPSASPPRRRTFLLGAGALVAGAGAMGWQAAFAGTIETGFGERRRLRLADGSALLLDAQTRVREPWLRDRRLELRRGRISVRSPSRDGTDFIVTTSAHRIAANGVDADLSWEHDWLTVSVLAGALRVASGDAAPVTLVAGQRLLPSGLIDQPAMAALTAWRDGRLVFAETPLADACAELNRYDAARLVPAPEVAGLRISGTYPMGRNARFAQALEQLLPVRVRAANGMLLLTRSAAAHNPPRAGTEDDRGAQQ